jgi:hypothetical protein
MEKRGECFSHRSHGELRSAFRDKVIPDLMETEEKRLAPQIGEIFLRLVDKTGNHIAGPLNVGFQRFLSLIVSCSRHLHTRSEGPFKME